VTRVTPVRILIADDHELVRQGMRAILDREPAWVVCAEASTGRQALAKAMELRPDLMILDLGLPEMNGVEVTRRVRSAFPVAVLIVTVNDSDDAVREAINAGANGYLLKADAGRTLADAVHAILSDGEFVSEGVRAAADLGSPEGQASRRGTSERLTPREREVLQLMAEGRSNRGIAQRLWISEGAVEKHVHSILGKFRLPVTEDDHRRVLAVVTFLNSR
jgi:DNA-binding NarL/FixJ family response regulator